MQVGYQQEFSARSHWSSIYHFLADGRGTKYFVDWDDTEKVISDLVFLSGGGAIQSTAEVMDAFFGEEGSEEEEEEEEEDEDE